MWKEPHGYDGFWYRYDVKHFAVLDPYREDVVGTSTDVQIRKFAVINQIGEMIGEEPQKPEPVAQEQTTQAAQQASESTRPPRWADIREMTEKAPLKDLSVAMAVIMSRFDDEIVNSR